MKTKTLLGGLAVGIAALIGLDNTGPIQRDCEVYQGYTVEPSEGAVNYVFDPTEVYSRSGYPKYVIEGNPELADSLKIGERYCFEFKDPKVFWASDKLKSITLENKVD